MIGTKLLICVIVIQIPYSFQREKKSLCFKNKQAVIKHRNKCSEKPDINMYMQNTEIEACFEDPGKECELGNFKEKLGLELSVEEGVGLSSEGGGRKN